VCHSCTKAELRRGKKAGSLCASRSNLVTCFLYAEASL